MNHALMALARGLCLQHLRRISVGLSAPVLCAELCRIQIRVCQSDKFHAWMYGIPPDVIDFSGHTTPYYSNSKYRIHLFASFFLVVVFTEVLDGVRRLYDKKKGIKAFYDKIKWLTSRKMIGKLIRMKFSK